MKPEEANRIISEYMGVSLWYKSSLDHLVPVLLKIAKERKHVTHYRICVWAHSCYDFDFSFFNYENCEEEESYSLQEAAAISIAKDILELGK